MRIRRDQQAALAFDSAPIPAERPSSVRPKKVWRGLSPAQFDRVRVEVTRMVRTNEWRDARPTHFVVLYEILYKDVYRAEPRLTAAERGFASMLAGKQLREEFAGDQRRMAEYMRWAWGVERWREQNRAETDDFTLSTRYLFGPKRARDYRVAMERKATRC